MTGALRRVFGRRTARLVAVGAVALAVSSGPAGADALGTPPMKTGAPVSIGAYGRQNPACLEWTNGCVLCIRVDGQSHCSTPGIACTPAGLTCKRLAR